MGDLNRYIFHLTKIGMTWGGAIISVALEYTPVVQNAAIIQIICWTIIKVKPGALGQILHPVGDH